MQRASSFPERVYSGSILPKTQTRLPLSGLWPCATIQTPVLPPLEDTLVRFVVFGHLTRDIIPGGYTLGGTASYAAITAHRLGAQVTVVTRADPDDARHPAFADIEVINLSSPYTTTFQNFYQPDGTRLQQVRVVAAPIFVDDLPDGVCKADVALLAPVCQEIDPAIAPKLDAIVGCVPQGWMREWDERGRVYAVPWLSAGRLLPYLDMVALSKQDMAADPDFLTTLTGAVPVVALTQGYAGCTVYTGSQTHTITPRPATEVDATGAGDVFCAAFLVRLWESKDPLEAAYFATVAASLSIEATGVEGIPLRADVEAYLRQYRLPGV